MTANANSYREKLDRAIEEFTDFLNEPPQYEDQFRVREYRHEAYGKWVKLLDLLNSHDGQSSEDSKRLDFIEAKDATVYRGMTGHWVFVEERGKYPEQRRGIIGKTLRDAIDSALSATKEQE